MPKPSKCDHTPCTCPPLPGRQHCSDACRKASGHDIAGGAVKQPCKCNHSDCAGVKAIHTQEESPAITTPGPDAVAS